MFSRRSTLAFAAAAVATILFAACGGDDTGPSASPTAGPTASPTPRLTDPPSAIEQAEETYFEKLGAEMATITSRFVELDESRVAGLDEDLGENARLINIRAYSAGYLDLAEDSFKALDPITAPPSLADLHSALVDAFEGVIPLGEDLVLAMDIDAALTEDDFAGAFFDLDGVTLEQRLRDACHDLLFFAVGKDAATEIVCPR